MSKSDTADNKNSVLAHFETFYFLPSNNDYMHITQPLWHSWTENKMAKKQ